MVPLWSLPMLAVLFAVCAAGLAALRRVGKRRALVDAAAAMQASLVSIAAGVFFYATAGRSTEGAILRNVGALCFMAFPVASAVVLSRAAQKRGWSRGSVLGILIGTGLAVALVAAWMTVYLKGPRGGWTPREILVCLVSVCAAFTASSCLGWWCGRITR